MLDGWLWSVPSRARRTMDGSRWSLFYFRDDNVGWMALKRSLSRASHNGCLVEFSHSWNVLSLYHFTCMYRFTCIVSPVSFHLYRFTCISRAHARSMMSRLCITFQSYQVQREISSSHALKSMLEVGTLEAEFLQANILEALFCHTFISNYHHTYRL
jgi:hypothetical protein